MKETTTLAEINSYTGSTINPLNSPDTTYELYSVPSFDNSFPEVLQGKEIGSSKATVEEGDVLVCKINPRINRVWVVKHNTNYPLLASSEWIVVRSPENNSDYLKWYFRSPYIMRLMVSQVTGIGGSLTRAQPKQVATYPVPLVSYEEQRGIAEILNRIEGLAKKREYQLNKLDELVKARFVELFGNPISNPLNWDTYQLGEFLTRIDNGRSFICSDKPRIGNRPAVLKLSASTYGDYRPAENKAILDEGMFIESAEVHSGDLLFTRKNTPELVGMAAYIQETPPKLMMPDLIFRLVPNERMNAVFLWQLINCKEFRPVIQGISGGSAKSMSNISKERLRKIRVICPPKSVQDELIPFISQVNKSKLSIQASLDQLETMKRSLMQKYFG